MNIDELLLTIETMAKRNGLSKPFVVGGVPRDRLMKQRGKEINVTCVCH